MENYFSLETIAIFCIIILCLSALLCFIFSKVGNLIGCWVCIFVVLVSISFMIGSTLYYQDVYNHYNITLNGVIYHCEDYYIHDNMFVLKFVDGTQLRFYKPTDVKIEILENCECDNQ